MFADFAVGILLGKVSARPDIQGLLATVSALQRAELQTDLNRSAAPPYYPNQEVADEGKRQKEIQTRVLGHLRTIVKAAVRGAGPRAVAYQRELMKDLDVDFARLMVFEALLERNIDARRHKLQILTGMEIAVVVAWGLATVAVALWLSAYFRRHFIVRLERIKANIERIAAGKEPVGTLSGSDEIFELDEAFHAMHAQLRIAAARERALFDNSTEVFSVMDENLRVVRINKASEQLWELPWGSIPGNSLENLLAPSDFKRVQPLFFDAARHPEQSIGFETESAIVGGSLIQSQWSCVWSGTQKLYYSVIHDVTDERKLARLKRSFLELIAAAFRDPLKRVSEVFEELAHNQPDLDQTARTKVDGATRTLNRLVASVDDLLQLEAVESRDGNLERCECNVAEMMKEAVNDVQALASVRNIEIELDCQSETWFLDSRRIIQVLCNLLSNAIKFSPDGGKVRLTASNISQGIRISVQDWGRGIPESFKEQVFYPFKQSRASDGTRGKGSGLGLVIARKVVQQHGGEIDFESQENQGTVFWFTLPAAAEGQSRSALVIDSQVLASESTSVLEPELKVPIQKDSPARKRPTFGAGGQLSLQRKMQVLVGVPVLFQLVFVILMSGLLFKAGAEQDLQFRQMDTTSSAVKLAIGLCLPSVGWCHWRNAAEQG